MRELSVQVPRRRLVRHDGVTQIWARHDRTTYLAKSKKRRLAQRISAERTISQSPNTIGVIFVACSAILDCVADSG